MMAIKTVNALSHYTDWTIGHVHAGALGWVAMITFGSLYHMIPKVFGREQMHSVPLINLHFWLAAWWISHRTLVGLPVPQRKPIIDYQIGRASCRERV